MFTRIAVLALVVSFIAGVRASGQDKAKSLDKVRSQYAQLDDPKMKVHYKSIGEGTTALVLVHGWSCDLSVWKDQLPALEGKMRLVLIDLPGHGKSDRPKVEYTMDLFARAVEAVLADAKVDSAVLAGHSMGTPVVRQYYRLYPKKTKALIAVDGALRPFSTDPKFMAKFLSMFEGDSFKEAVAKFAETMFKEGTPKEVRAFVKEKLDAADQRIALSAMKNMMDAKVWKEDAIDVPLLCLMAKSPFWPEDYEKFVRKLAPKVDYRVMDDVGHFLMLEAPEAFNRQFVGFLERNGFVKRGEE